jgi:protein-disulfide isomerase
MESSEARTSPRAAATAAVLGGVLLVVVTVGTAVALLGVHQLRAELELLRTAVAGRVSATAAPPPPELPAEPVSLAGAPVKGSQDAQVAILEFSDFQCPYCARFTTSTWPDLLREYVDPGKVLVAFRHLPLDQIHPQARGAAEASACAAKQGLFWEFHDRLFEMPPRLGRDDLVGHAESAGVAVRTFEACLGDRKTLDAVRRDVAEAERLQVYGTPAFLIGVVEADGRLRVTDRFSGAHRIETFRPVLDRLLAGSEAR